MTNWAHSIHIRTIVCNNKRVGATVEASQLSATTEFSQKGLTLDLKPVMPSNILLKSGFWQTTCR